MSNRGRICHLNPEVLIGVATAAHQVEGGLDDKNDVGDFTQTHPFAEGGEYKEPAGLAADHYNRYVEDLDILQDLGMQVYRFGIEWARIEPEPGRFDAREIAHYRDVLRACRERGIVPMVTLHHFSSPKWLIAQGGWGSDATSAYFGRYAKLIANELGDLIAGVSYPGQKPGFVCTLNEINTGILNASMKMPPEQRVLAPAWQESAARLGVSPDQLRPWQMASDEKDIRVIVAAHHEAVRAIRSVRKDILVGATIASQDITAIDPQNSEYVDFARAEMWRRENRMSEILRELPDLIGDFIGIQPYTHLRVGTRPDGVIGVLDPPSDARMVTANREFAPHSLPNCIRRADQMFPGLPQFITEFGVSTPNEAWRIEYLQTGLAGLSDCLDDRINVIGFTAWAALRTFEWEKGMHMQRYGLVDVDWDTQERTVTPTAKALSKIAKEREFVRPLGGLDAPGAVLS